MRALALAVVVALVGCRQYAHRSFTNAPGNVDLAQPLPNENGDPARFEPAREPGTRTVTIAAMPYIAGGIGRYEAGRDGTGEAGLELRAERTESDGKNLIDLENWGATLGFGIVQWGDSVRTVAPSAFSAELNVRFLAKVWPIDVGLGPAFYVDDPTVGGQLSVRLAALMLVRARYMANSGAEFFIGAQIPVPFFFQWSR